MHKILKFSWLTVSILFLAVFSQLVSAKIIVDINISAPEHHLADIRLSLPKTSSASVELKLPTWRTGRYEILNLANGIRDFSVTDKTGAQLVWQKTDKSTWLISNTQGKKLTVKYQLYANQLAKRTRHIDDSHAFLDASAVVMYNPTQRQLPYQINLDVPRKWRSASGLKKGRNKHQFVAKNYDEFVDSPIESGLQKVQKFVVDGRDYELVIWGEGNYDSAKMAADLAIIVKQAKFIWSDYPFSRYVFMVHATSGARGATEHINSTIIQRSRYAFSARDDYLGFLSTAAHEFVHTWNVKQYRPQGLYPYDYQKENYTNLLWVAEGSTSYFQNQLLLRGQLMSTDEFFKALAKRVEGYLHKPGRKSQTVAQASFDNWISEGGDYANNNSVNIYSEGFLVSWMLDFDILASSNNKKSYRDVHNLLYKNYRLPHAFNEDDMKTVLTAITGKDYSAWWQQNVHGYAEPDFDQLLALAGLEMFYGEKNSVKAWSGIKTKLKNNHVEITGIEKNSPAWSAGLSSGDVIVALNGLKLKDHDLTKRLADFKPSEMLEFTFFRRDQLMTKTLKLTGMAKEPLKIRAIKNASDQQKKFFKAWTGRELSF